MKQFIQSTTSAFLALILVLGLCACGKTDTVKTDMTPVYTQDTELGEGSKSVSLEVKTPDSSVKFTIHTDKTILGDALTEYGLISGDEGEYGLYIKKVNGITADYDIDQSYWSFYINGEYAPTGVDSTEITEGAEYQLVYTK